MGGGEHVTRAYTSQGRVAITGASGQTKVQLGQLPTPSAMKLQHVGYVLAY